MTLTNSRMGKEGVTHLSPSELQNVPLRGNQVNAYYFLYKVFMSNIVFYNRTIKAKKLILNYVKIESQSKSRVNYLVKYKLEKCISILLYIKIEISLFKWEKINIIILWFNDITQLMMRLNGVKYINNIELSIIYRINRDTMLLVEKNEIKCYSWKKEIQY